MDKETLNKLLPYCLDSDGILELLLEAERDAFKIQLIENFEDDAIDCMWELCALLVNMGVTESDAMSLADFFWSRVIRMRLRSGRLHPNGKMLTGTESTSFEMLFVERPE